MIRAWAVPPSVRVEDRGAAEHSIRAQAELAWAVGSGSGVAWGPAGAREEVGLAAVRLAAADRERAGAAPRRAVDRELVVGAPRTASGVR